MCDHKPKFLNYYFLRKRTLSKKSALKETYKCKKCGSVISISEKSAILEVMAGISMCIIPIILVFLLSLVDGLNIFKTDIEVLKKIFVVVTYFFAEFIFEYIIYRIIVFRANTDK